MSKDQVWKIIFFFHTNKQQQNFSRFENDRKIFHNFPCCIGTLEKVPAETLPRQQVTNHWTNQTQSIINEINNTDESRRQQSFPLKQ